MVARRVTYLKKDYTVCSAGIFQPYLCASYTDDAIHGPAGIVEERHSDGMLSGRNPVSLSGRINLEDVRLCAEERLLPVERHKNYITSFLFTVLRTLCTF